MRIWQYIGWLVLFSSMAAPVFGQSAYWYDGDTRIPLWAAEAGSPPVVFRETTAAGAPKLRLTGRVIVRFSSRPSQELQARLVSNYDLKFVRDLGIGISTWLYAAPDVAASLDLANRLAESGEVATAFPDWENAR